MEGSASPTSTRAWLDHLADDDIAFIKRFLLASGTLKELARQYGVSYPTLRLRLDRLIEKVKLYDSSAEASPFELRLRTLFGDGRVDEETFRSLLDLYRAELHAQTDQGRGE